MADVYEVLPGGIATATLSPTRAPAHNLQRETPMTRYATSTLLVSLLFIGTGCDRSAARPDTGHDTVMASAADQHAVHDEQAGSGHAAGGHAAAGVEATTLLPIMQRLGSNMTALTYALMTDDRATIKEQAAAIAAHAPISEAELQRIQRVLGPDMAKFEALDESVHVASVRLHDASQTSWGAEAVDRLGEVQRGCVSCHSQFRERLRTNAAPK